MPKNTSVELGDDLAAFIDNQVHVGRYASASEVVRAGLRHLQNEETRLAALRQAVRSGLESGESQNFDFDTFIASRQSGR